LIPGSSDDVSFGALYASAGQFCAEVLLLKIWYARDTSCECHTDVTWCLQDARIVLSSFDRQLQQLPMPGGVSHTRPALRASAALHAGVGCHCMSVPARVLQSCHTRRAADRHYISGHTLMFMNAIVTARCRWLFKMHAVVPVLLNLPVPQVLMLTAW
jgi:hypothetical protein